MAVNHNYQIELINRHIDKIAECIKSINEEMNNKYKLTIKNKFHIHEEVKDIADNVASIKYLLQEND